MSTKQNSRQHYLHSNVQPANGSVSSFTRESIKSYNNYLGQQQTGPISKATLQTFDKLRNVRSLTPDKQSTAQPRAPAQGSFVQPVSSPEHLTNGSRSQSTVSGKPSSKKQGSSKTQPQLLSSHTSRTQNSKSVSGAPQVFNLTQPIP